MHDPRAIANFVLDRAEINDRLVTNIDINKIVYFLHGWHLVFFSSPLTFAKIEAWKYGPVFRELYSEFKKFGASPITGRASRINPQTLVRETCVATFSDNELPFITQMTDEYLGLRTSELVNMSHVANGPWHSVFYHKGRSNPGMRIPDDLIREYFSKQVRH